MDEDFSKLSYLNPASGLKASFKKNDQDFVVDEIMPIEPDGSGEHCWLKVKKQSANTDYVAKQLAVFAGIKASSVSYAGLKDRHAITTQWFSLHMPGMPDPDWSKCQQQDFIILESHRHSRKLKRGALTGNRFNLRLTDCSGPEENWHQRLQQIADNGVPNYFGEQRFGHQMNNLKRATEVLEKNKLRRLKPAKRSIYLSAMRSWIFNRIVSERIQHQRFEQPESGDVYMLASSQACFESEPDEQIQQRLSEHDIFLTASLWGRGQSMASETVFDTEQQVAAEYKSFANGLEQAGMKQERRAMRLMPVNMKWQFDDTDTLVVSFELTKGSYATMVLRELGEIVDASQPDRK